MSSRVILSPKARETTVPAGRQRKLFLTQPSIVFTPSPDFTRPTHSGEGKIMCSTLCLDSNANVTQRYPHGHTQHHVLWNTVKPWIASNLFCVPQDEQTLVINLSLKNERWMSGKSRTWCRMSHDHNWDSGSWNSLWYASALDYKRVSRMNYARKQRFYCMWEPRSSVN